MIVIHPSIIWTIEVKIVIWYKISILVGYKHRPIIYLSSCWLIIRLTRDIISSVCDLVEGEDKKGNDDCKPT